MHGVKSSLCTTHTTHILYTYINIYNTNLNWMPFVRFYFVHSLVCNISISITTFCFSFSLCLGVCVCVNVQRNSRWLFNTQYYYHPLKYLLLIHILPLSFAAAVAGLRVAFILFRLWFHYVSLLTSVLPLQHNSANHAYESQCNAAVPHSVLRNESFIFIELILFFFHLLRHLRSFIPQTISKDRRKNYT